MVWLLSPAAANAEDSALIALSAAADVFVCQKHPLPLTVRTLSLSLVPKGPKTYPRSDLTSDFSLDLSDSEILRFPYFPSEFFPKVLVLGRNRDKLNSPPC